MKFVPLPGENQVIIRIIAIRYISQYLSFKELIYPIQSISQYLFL